MNEEVLGRLLRTILQAAGVWVAAKYGIEEGNITAVSGAIVTIVTTAYTVWTSWNTRKVPA